MELYIFGRFHARAGEENEVEQGIREVVRLTSKEPGCVNISAFRGVRDARLFYIHARWADVESFEVHARQSHTVEFLKFIEPLVDHPLDIKRTEVIG